MGNRGKTPVGGVDPEDLGPFTVLEEAGGKEREFCQEGPGLLWEGGG